jgi:hypothetical protein
MGFKRRLQPLQPPMLDHHHIKATRRPTPPTAQIMLGSKHDALLFTQADTGQSPTMARISTFANLDKHHGTARLAHNQVNLTTAAPWCPIIARQQTQALVLQILQGFLF